MANTSRVIVEDNDLSHNRFAVIVEAGFPVAITLLHGDIELSMKGNLMSESCQSSLLVSLNRHTTALGVQPGPALMNSTFTLTLGDNIAWSDAWFAHPAGFNNTLTVDGAAIAKRSRVAYTPTRVCPSV